MIAVDTRRTIGGLPPVARTSGVAIPDWGRIPGLQLLRYVDDYEDAVFNCLQLGALLEDLDKWLAYEIDSGDPEGRVGTITALVDQVREADRRGLYIVFMGE